MSLTTTAPPDSPVVQLPAGAVERSWRVMPDAMATKLSQGAWSSAPHLQLISFLMYLGHIKVLRRVIINMPPGHGKTQTVSEWTPAWLMEMDPKTRVILASYGATLAEESGKNVRGILTEHRDDLTVRLRQDSQASDRWRTTGGGGMWTAGIDGTVTGRRASALFIDDPHKNFEDAHSLTRRERVWNFYRSTARNRLLPGGFIAVVHTRWHEDDLTGRLLEAASTGTSTPFVHVRFPAIAEEDETIQTVLGEKVCAKLTALGIPLPFWRREKGQALWPRMLVNGEWTQWYDEGELADLRIDSGEYIWNGLYQQRPSSPTGSYFPVDKWGYVDAPPSRCRFVRRWDLAATESGGDATAGVLVAYDDVDKHVFIVDVVVAHLAASGVRALVSETAARDREQWGRKVHTVVEQEPGSSGKALAEQYVTDVLAGYSAEYKLTTGDKEVNASPLASQQQIGNVYLCKAFDEATRTYDRPRWWGTFIEELRAFPNGTHDDQVDAASHGFSDLMGGKARKSKAGIRSMAERHAP